MNYELLLLKCVHQFIAPECKLWYVFLTCPLDYLVALGTNQPAVIRYIAMQVCFALVTAVANKILITPLL